MTYAALAKSLGISFKSSSSSTSTASGALPAPVPGSTSTSASSSSLKDNLQERSSSVVETPKTAEEENHENKQGKDATYSETPSAAAGGTTETVPEQTPIKVPEVPGVEDADSDADAEGVIDSDIGSSRPPSPHLAPAKGSSQEENTTEAREIRSSEPRAASQYTDVDTSVEESNFREPEIPQSLKRESMTDEQLHHAKVLVLDLLGWGVPPEYLLQRGISHALLYTVFTDLRLRIPDAIFADCIKLVSAQL